MNNEATNGLEELADNSILLDSNVIVSMFANYAQRQHETDIALKIAAVTFDNFLVLENTVKELYGFADRLKTEKDSRIRDYLDTNFLKSPRDFDKTLDTLLNRKIFKVVKQERKVEVSVDLAKIFQENTVRSKTAQATDLALILVSRVHSIPVFTYDFEIMRVINGGMGSAISEFKVPFPFNRDELKDIQLDEIMDLSTPLRRLYKKAFNKIKDDVSTTEKLEQNLRYKNEFMRRQRKILIELNSDLINAKETIQKWKKFSKPNITETITWTMVELGLGFVPLPIPTSPINHFIQSARYKKLELEQDAELEK